MAITIKTNDLKKPLNFGLSAFLAISALVLFFLAYLALSSWFVYTGFRLFTNSNASFLSYIAGFFAWFLAVFMLKALFFIKRNTTQGLLELQRSQQPQLFAFLDELADKAGAPRAHKVFVSASVNAAVFYELSLINLIFPSKKNLEIGLGLVNVLSLGELKAVLAHEYGHFAQKTMAIGRWVYIGQQIAAHIIAKRDKLDEFLRGLGRIDIRISWIAWILTGIVWAIRCLVETLFSAVILLQRALSREMEMQADLVAVRLTGSDALVHALHKLQAGDDSWGRSLAFAFNQKELNRPPQDLFAIQSFIVRRLAEIWSDADYGQAPAIPRDNPQAHRLFQSGLAQPPKMWLSHPLNHEREENAKRNYVAAEIDSKSAWCLFEQEQSLRTELSKLVLQLDATATTSISDSLQELSQQYNREYLQTRYRGNFLGRSITQHAKHSAELFDKASPASLTDWQALYPASLNSQLEKFRQLETEINQLEALKAGYWQTQDGRLQYRGVSYSRAEADNLLRQIKAEFQQIQHELEAHDKQCRSLHYALACQYRQGWPDYLAGLLSILHFAEHSLANLLDLRGVLGHTVRVVSAARVTDDGRLDVISKANYLHEATLELFKLAKEIVLPADLLENLAATDLVSYLGEYKLPYASQENIGDWLNAVDSWQAAICENLRNLQMQTLDLLLKSENGLAAAVFEQAELGSAPELKPLQVDYPRLVPGQERARDARLSWWQKFQVADGKLAGSARFAVAATIIAVVLGMGGHIGQASLYIYNGLATSVQVKIDQTSFTLQAGQYQTIDLNTQSHHQISTSLPDQRLIEQFTAASDQHGVTYIYNIAAAIPMIEWSQVYGRANPEPNRHFSDERWFASHAEVFFSEPPASMRSKKGGETVRVLSAGADISVPQQLDFYKDKTIRQQVIDLHARHDALDSANIMYWLYLAADSSKDYAAILTERLQREPNQVLLLRAGQDYFAAHDKAAKEQLCQRINELSQQSATNGAYQYLAVRCLADQKAQNQAWKQLRQKYPEEPWLNYVTGMDYAEQAQWQAAFNEFWQVYHRSIPMRVMIRHDIFRLARLQQATNPQRYQDLLKDSHELQQLASFEQNYDKLPQPDPYTLLAHGKIEAALAEYKRDSKRYSRVIRLIAASDGANREVYDLFQQIAKDEGLDEVTVWSSLALAMRDKASTQNYLDFLNSKSELKVATEKILAFLTSIKNPKNYPNAERLLDGVNPALRAQAYVMASIIQGEKLPVSWRQQAKALLFANERPYLN